MRPTDSIRGLRAASAPSMTPSGVMIPARYISAIASMIPEPQTPVTPRSLGRLGEARIVRPEIAADHLEARLQRRAVDAHALDRARRGALAAGDLRALEGGAGRRGAGEQALAIAEHDLRVGADVDEQRQLVAKVGRLGEHDAGRVGADMAGDAGQRIDEGAGRDVEAEVSRARLVGAVDRQREGRAAEFGRIEAEEEMMHDRIADQRDLEDLARATSASAAASPISASIASRTARVSSASPPGFIIT